MVPADSGVDVVGQQLEAACGHITKIRLRLPVGAQRTRQRSLSISPIGRRLSTRSQTLFKTIIMGTATNIPISPQIQLQNNKPINIDTPLMLAALPMTAGLTSIPSILKITIGITASSAAIAAESN